ncbi:MAG: CDGSH iron-sulfur domain-containing protein [Bacteroidota bacterium]|nr:CDGSH iron-sulfur domain-containing protein [Bacteroidota bacterium]
MSDSSKPYNAEFSFKPGASLKIKGNFILKDSQGNIIPTGDYIKLCRCGKSKSQPFCDHSHRTA